MTAPALRLPGDVLQAWNTAQFAARLKQALEGLPSGTLPLGRAGPNGGAVDDSQVVVTVRRWAMEGGEISADVAVFHDEIIAGCSCGDEPMALIACALVRVHLDGVTGAVRFTRLNPD